MKYLNEYEVSDVVVIPDEA